MATCASCGKAVGTGRGDSGIRSKGKVYHISCAPATLLDTAVEEWDAIMGRGVEYFGEKYTPAGTGWKRSGKDGETLLLKRFAEFGEKLKREARSRRAGSD